MRRLLVLVPLLAGLAARAEAPEAGIAVLASAVGHGQSPDDIRAFVAEGHFRHVVVDWAWITAHWDRTDFAAVEALVSGLRKDGVAVAAMYRPRFFAGDESATGVQVQVGEDGKPADPSHREICFSSEKARAWGAKWAGEILAKCPSFEEVTVYNPRDFCRCADCVAAAKDDPNAGTRRFLAEVKAAIGKARPGGRLAVVYPPVPAWFEAMKSVVDVARPYVYLLDDADFAADIAAATKVRAQAAHAGPALAKITWGANERMTDRRLAEFVSRASEAKLPFVFWTWDTAFLEGQYDLDALARALHADPAKLKPLIRRLGGIVRGPDGKPAPADPAEVRKAVAEALAKTDGEAGVAWKSVADRFGAAAVEEVARILADRQRTVQQRFLAAWCLGAIGAPEGVVALLAAAGDEQWVIRLYAVEALGKTGYGNKDVERRLKELSANDPAVQPDPKTGKDAWPVRDAASAALKALAGPPPEPKGPRAPTSLDLIPWANSLEDGLELARRQNRMVLAFVLPFENGYFEDGYDGCEAVRAAHPLAAGISEEEARSRETGFVKERAILAALLGEPRIASLVSRRFVLVRLRLETYHFPAKGPAPGADPLKKLGTTCGECRAPAILFASPEGRLIHHVASMGVFSPAWFRAACVAVLERNPDLAGLDERAEAARQDSLAKPADSSLRRRLVEELIASGADREAQVAIGQASGDWATLARAEIRLLEGDAQEALRTLENASVTNPLRAARSALLGEAFVRQRRWVEAYGALKVALAATPDDPARDKADYLLGVIRDADGETAVAVSTWRPLLDRSPSGPWSGLAAARLSRVGPFFDEWTTTVPLSVEALAVRTETGLASNNAVERAVDVLLRMQRPDGTWRNPSLQLDPAEPAGAPFDYSIPRSALAARALRTALPRLDAARQKKAREAIARAAGLIDGWSDRPQDWIWQVTYALDFEARTWAEAKGAAKEAAAKRVTKLLGCVARLESNGGWSYMPPPRLHVFNTAPILLELAELKAAGWAVDEAMMKRAAAFLEKNRIGGKAVFHYGATLEHLTSADEPGGSSMRSPLAELALHTAGFSKDPAPLREAIDLFFEHLGDVRRTARLFESYFDGTVMHDAYHYFFGCWYGARAIRALPPGEQAPLAGRLLEALLPLQEVDGSFVDAQMQGKSTSTALALLAILEALEAQK